MAFNGDRLILLTFLYPILICLIDVLYLNFISSSSFHNAECVFGTRNCRVTSSVDKNSILSPVSKIFEHLNDKQLHAFIEENAILSRH